MGNQSWLTNFRTPCISDGRYSIYLYIIHLIYVSERVWKGCVFPHSSKPNLRHVISDFNESPEHIHHPSDSIVESQLILHNLMKGFPNGAQNKGARRATTDHANGLTLIAFKESSWVALTTP